MPGTDQAPRGDGALHPGRGGGALPGDAPQGDYAYYDYILAMDDSNIEDIQSLVGPDTENKIHRLLDFTDQPRNIRDPWYTGNFDESYWDIYEGCQAFLNSLDLRT